MIGLWIWRSISAGRMFCWRLGERGIGVGYISCICSMIVEFSAIVDSQLDEIVEDRKNASIVLTALLKGVVALFLMVPVS